MQLLMPNQALYPVQLEYVQMMQLLMHNQEL